MIQNCLHQNKNRNEVKNREIRYLHDLSIFNLLSVFVMVQRILSYYPNHPTRLYILGKSKHIIRVDLQQYLMSSLNETLPMLKYSLK